MLPKKVGDYIMASCVVLMFFIAIWTILPCEKGVVLKLANVPSRKMII